MYAPDIVIAVALVALVLVFIRISWTLKEICDAIAVGGARAGSGSQAAHGASGTAESAAQPSAVSAVEASPNETEIAAVIAIAHAAMRAAV